MPRDHARIGLGIWSDDDFRSLPANAQHLYWILLTHPELSYCGVLDWRPAKLSGLVGDWTADNVQAAADILIERLYIVVDETTEEVLVRSFVRRDGLMKQPKMATAMATAHAAVGSVALRGVVIGELQRLHREDPDLKGWGSQKASDLLSKSAVDPSTYPCGKGSGKAWGNPKAESSDEPSGKGSVSPSSLLLTPTPEEKDTAPRKRGRRIPDDFAVNDEMREWAIGNGFGHLDLDKLTSEFRDYWAAESGQRAVKLDWVKTWNNRVRAVAERTPRQTVGASSGRPSWEL